MQKKSKKNLKKEKGNFVLAVIKNGTTNTCMGIH